MTTSWATKINEAGFKATSRRIELLTLLQNENRYMAPLHIYEALAINHPGLSYDTVYRNLREFEEAHLLEVTDLEGEKRYRLNCGDHKHHHHFVCTKCGRTMPLEICPMSTFAEQLPGCVITGHRFEIYGLCEKCAKLGRNNNKLL